MTPVGGSNKNLHLGKRPAAESAERPPDAKKSRSSVLGHDISATSGASRLSRAASSQDLTQDPDSVRLIKVSEPESSAIVDLTDDAAANRASQEQALLNKIRSTKRLCMKFKELINDPAIGSDQCRDALIEACFDYLQSGKASFEQALDLLTKLDSWKNQHWLHSIMGPIVDKIDERLVDVVGRYPGLLEECQRFRHLLSGVVKQKIYMLVRMLKSSGMMDINWRINDKTKVAKVLDSITLDVIRASNLHYISGALEILECMKLDKKNFLRWLNYCGPDPKELVYNTQAYEENNIVSEIKRWLRSQSDKDIYLNEIKLESLKTQKKEDKDLSHFLVMVRLVKHLPLFHDKRLTLPPNRLLPSSDTKQFDLWLSELIKSNQENTRLLPHLLPLFFNKETFQRHLFLFDRVSDKDSWKLLVRNCHSQNLKYLFNIKSIPLEALAVLVCRCHQEKVMVPAAVEAQLDSLSGKALTRYYLNPYVAKKLVRGSLPKEPSCRAALVAGAHDLPKAREMLSELKALPVPLAPKERRQWSNALKFLARLPELASELVSTELGGKVSSTAFLSHALSERPGLLNSLSNRDALIRMNKGEVICHALETLDKIPEHWLTYLVNNKESFSPHVLYRLCSRHEELGQAFKVEALARCEKYQLSLLAQQHLFFAKYVLEQNRLELLNSVHHPEIKQRISLSMEQDGQKKITLESAWALLQKTPGSINSEQLFDACWRYEDIADKVFSRADLRDLLTQDNCFKLAKRHSAVAFKFFDQANTSERVELAKCHVAVMEQILTRGIGVFRTFRTVLTSDTLLSILCQPVHGDIISILPESPCAKLLSASDWTSLACCHKALAKDLLSCPQIISMLTAGQLCQIGNCHLEFAQAMIEAPNLKKMQPLKSGHWVELLQTHEELISHLSQAQHIQLEQEDWERIGQTSGRHYDRVSMGRPLKCPRPVVKERLIDAPERLARTHRQTFGAFSQAVLPSSVMAEISSVEGCCAGFALDFLRFCRKYTSSFPAAWPTDYVRKTHSRDTSFSRSFVNRLLHYQHNQRMYIEKAQGFFSASQLLEKKNTRLLTMLENCPELFLSSGVHAIGIVYRVDPDTSRGHYFVSDSNRGIYHFDASRDTSCLFKLVEEWLMSTGGSGSGEIMAHPVRDSIDHRCIGSRYRNYGSAEEPMDLTM